MSVQKFTDIDVAAFRRGAFASVSGMALCMGLAMPAHAQDADPDVETIEEQRDLSPVDEPVIEEEDSIVITGYLRSLENAQDIKRDADTFVDVITAEDIGALPDRSVAETLQRVPGINISRFAGQNDPDRFSVEGSGVIIRGLPDSYGRSELNGRDIFSATGGRSLSFNDVSPELLGRVEVYKNLTADMIDGQISGLVNLVTRKPIDNKGFKIAGTLEANVGDLAEEWSPGFSILASNTFEGDFGTFGLQAGYAQQELVTRADASQITDPCYRAETLDGPCIRFAPVGSGGYGEPIFGQDDFPPAGAVVVPKGAGVRTTGLERDREAVSLVGQWESPDRALLATVEYLRSENRGRLSEFSLLALVNDDAFFPVVAPGTTPVFNGIAAEQITLTQNTGGYPGIPTEALRFEQKDKSVTEDLSVDISWAVTDRLTVNFEGQNVESELDQAGIILAMRTFSDIGIDNSGQTPSVQFFQPGQGASGDTNSFLTDPSAIYYWFHLDNQIQNDGNLFSLKGDVSYDLDIGPIREVRFGTRWSDRDRVTRNANYSNWSNLGDTWTGRNGNWNCDDFQRFGCGGAYAFDFPGQSAIYDPFGDNFQRGNVPNPSGPSYFYGAMDADLVDAYLDGRLGNDLQAIKNFTLTPEGRPLLQDRPDVIPGTPFVPANISDVGEQTMAYYARVDLEHEFDNGMEIEANLGVRYVETQIDSDGVLSALQPSYVDAPNIVNGQNFGGDGDGVAEISDLQNRCANIPPGQTNRFGYCGLSPARQQQFVDGLTGAVINDDAATGYDNWLPAFNVKFEFAPGMIIRGAYSKGIVRPDLAAYSVGGALGDFTGVLSQEGSEETGPLFAVTTGGRFLRPLESWNADLSFEYYWDDVGSFTVSLFDKDISNLFGYGPQVRSLDIGAGENYDVLVTGPINFGEAGLRGVEFAFQDQFEFLPGFLSGFGTQLNYTYIDASDFGDVGDDGDIIGGLPFPGVSEHTYNAVLFYEKYGLSARAAYNWRSDFLLTPRDVIFPFSPIYGESQGQLDASIFYSITDQIKIGAQGVNLLDEVTRTSQVIDYDFNRINRSSFRNDRRFTFLLRFDF